MSANVRIAVVLVVVIIFWMASGLVAGKPEDGEVEAEKSLFKVKILSSEARPFSPPINVRARTEAERVVMVAAEIDGLVVATPIQEGAYVEKGAVLCELKREDRAARVKQAQAMLEKVKIDYHAALRLKNDGFQSKSQIASAKADLALGEADLERAQIALDNLQVRAPFSGIVQRRHKEPGDFIQRGMACAEMLDLDPIIIAGDVSGSTVALLKKGNAVTVNLASGFQGQATLRYVSSAARASTRTFRVEAEMENSDRKIPSGLIADMEISGVSVFAHVVAPSLLILLDDGNIGLRVVDVENRVAVYPIEILGESSTGVWVRGLPDKVDLIVVGQEYVTKGQLVEVERHKNTGVTES